MLITQDVKVIKNDDKSYKAYAFEKFNFEFTSKDPVKDYTPTTDGKPTQLNGADFKGTQAENELTKQPVTDEAIAELMLEAEAYCEAVSQTPRTNKKGEAVENPYTDKDGKPIAHAGKLYLLSLATQANTARIRLELDAANREKSADPKALFASMVKTKIKEALALRKVNLTEAQAVAIVLKSEARGLVDIAEESGTELSFEDALAQVTKTFVG